MTAGGARSTLRTEIVLQLFNISRDNSRSMLLDKTNRDHAPAVIQLSYQQAEHGFQKHLQRPCSGCCSTLITTGGTWFSRALTETSCSGGWATSMTQLQ